MVTAKIKDLFFDRALIIARVNIGVRDVFSKFGAYVRTRAKSSIRRRKRPSIPGMPPSSHVGTLRDLIYFGYDPFERSVVIGPTPTNQVFFKGDGSPVSGTGAQVLEEGGQIRILEVFKYGRWQRADLRSRRKLAGLKTRLRTIAIAPRPYMGPAAEIERSKLPTMWQNSIT